MKPLKIAYIKYNMSINLDPYNHRTSGGVLERLGILKALIEAGHKIAKPTPLLHKIDADEAKLDEMLAQIRAKEPPK